MQRTHDQGPFARYSEPVVGLANLVPPQVATAIFMRREIQARGAYVSELEQQRPRNASSKVARGTADPAGFAPEAVPELEGWEISPNYRPAREVGGDFYDFLELEDGRLGLVVGDATGKGVPAALVMSTTCGMLGAVTQASDSTPRPARCLSGSTRRCLLAYRPTCSSPASTPSSTQERYLELRQRRT